MSDGRLFLCFFPYLRLNDLYDFGPWRIQSVDEYGGRWANAEFERLGRLFVHAFRLGEQEMPDGGQILIHRKQGVNGRLPSHAQRLAIQRAIDFSVLDRTPSTGDPNAGLFAATSDNSELMIWPIDPDGWISLGRGGMVRTTTFGSRIGPHLKVSAPLEVRMTLPLQLDGELLSAMYSLLAGRSPVDEKRRRARVGISIDWLSKAWRNSSSIRMEERIVLLKTGFEALSGSSDSFQCAKWLRELFETNLGTTLPSKHARGLLWSPLEREHHTLTHRGKTYTITDLQAWFMAFARVRNEVIHDGVTRSISYRGKGAYKGEYVLVAERLLRESIKVSMGELGFPDMWRSAAWRLSRRYLKRLVEASGVRK